MQKYFEAIEDPNVDSNTVTEPAFPSIGFDVPPDLDMDKQDDPLVKHLTALQEILYGAQMRLDQRRIGDGGAVPLTEAPD